MGTTREGPGGPLPWDDLPPAALFAVYAADFLIIIEDVSSFGNGFFMNPGHNKGRLVQKEEYHMERRTIMRSIGLGMAAGAALGLLMAPQKKTLKSTAKKAVRAVEDAAENMTQHLSM